MNSKATANIFNLIKRNFRSSSKNGIKVKIGDIRVNYETTGSNGKVVLCLPGALGSAATDFGPQMQAFPNLGIQAIFWDPPGYGKSIPPTRDFSADYFSKDAVIAAALMKKLGFEKYSLFGWSDGGVTALKIALKYPENIDKLVIWGVNSSFLEKDIILCEQTRDVSKWSERMRKPLEDLYGLEYLRHTWDECLNAMVRMYNENDGQIFEENLGSISSPTLIIHGKKDAVISGQHPLILHEKIKNSELVIWDDGKHNLHLRFAARFNDLVSTFLKK